MGVGESPKREVGAEAKMGISRYCVGPVTSNHLLVSGAYPVPEPEIYSQGPSP